MVKQIKKVLFIANSQNFYWEKMDTVRFEDCIGKKMNTIINVTKNYTISIHNKYLNSWFFLFGKHINGSYNPLKKDVAIRSKNLTLL